MEVVVLCVSEKDHAADDVDDCCSNPLARLCPFVSSPPRLRIPCFNHVQSRLTHWAWLGSHVSSLVSLEKAAWLWCWSSAAWELLVESDNILHARSICGTADGLYISLSACILLTVVFPRSVCVRVSLRRRIAVLRVCRRASSENVRWARQPGHEVSMCTHLHCRHLIPLVGLLRRPWLRCVLCEVI